MVVAQALVACSQPLCHPQRSPYDCHWLLSSLFQAENAVARSRHQHMPHLFLPPQSHSWVFWIGGGNNDTQKLKVECNITHHRLSTVPRLAIGPRHSEVWQPSWRGRQVQWTIILYMFIAYYFAIIFWISRMCSELFFTHPPPLERILSDVTTITSCFSIWRSMGFLCPIMLLLIGNIHTKS